MGVFLTIPRDYEGFLLSTSLVKKFLKLREPSYMVHVDKAMTQIENLLIKQDFSRPCPKVFYSCLIRMVYFQCILEEEFATARYSLVGRKKMMTLAANFVTGIHQRGGKQVSHLHTPHAEDREALWYCHEIVIRTSTHLL